MRKIATSNKEKAYREKDYELAKRYEKEDRRAIDDMTRYGDMLNNLIAKLPSRKLFNTFSFILL